MPKVFFDSIQFYCYSLIPCLFFLPFFCFLGGFLGVGVFFCQKGGNAYNEKRKYLFSGPFYFYFYFFYKWIGSFSMDCEVVSVVVVARGGGGVEIEEGLVFGVQTFKPCFGTAPVFDDGAKALHPSLSHIFVPRFYFPSFVFFKFTQGIKVVFCYLQFCCFLPIFDHFFFFSLIFRPFGLLLSKKLMY